MITKEAISASTKINAWSKQWALNNLDYLNSKNPLLGSSTKIEKGNSEKHFTKVLYLQPADKVATTTLCAFADGAGCKAPCLKGSGQLGMSIADNAATRKTILMLVNPVEFYRRLRAEITTAYKKHGSTLSIRLNGTSDVDFGSFCASMPNVQFYEYTKIYARVKKNTIANLDLTYSGSAISKKTIAMTARAVNEGHRVAIAFNTAETKGEFKVPTDIASFDTTDLRFLDGAGLGSLKYKGGSKAKRAATMNQDDFFFTPETHKQLIKLIAI